MSGLWTDEHMLTDSLHLSYDPGSYSSVSSLLQCRGSGTLQFTRQQSVAEVQHHTAGCVPANRAFTPLWGDPTWSTCRSYTKYLLTCCYLMLLCALHITFTTCKKQERVKLQPRIFYSENWRDVACFWDWLTWSCLSSWQESIEPAGLWQLNASDTWVTDWETEADRCWYCVGADGGWTRTV